MTYREPDPITVEVILNALQSVTDESFLALMKSAYSTNIKDVTTTRRRLSTDVAVWSCRRPTAFRCMSPRYSARWRRYWPNIRFPRLRPAMSSWPTTRTKAAARTCPMWRCLLYTSDAADES